MLTPANADDINKRIDHLHDKIMATQQVTLCLGEAIGNLCPAALDDALGRIEMQRDEAFQQGRDRVGIYLNDTIKALRGE